MIRIELLHQRVYNFRGMTISDQCMSIENLLDEVVFNQVASSYVDAKETFYTTKELKSLNTDLSIIMVVIDLFWWPTKAALTLWPLRVTASNFSLQYLPWITQQGHKNKGNDQQLKMLLIVKQILLVSTLKMHREQYREYAYWC